MYSVLLSTHSLLRWLVLASLTASIFKAFRGRFKRLPFTPADNKLRTTTTSIAHLQLIFGITLYFVSPLTDYFLKNYSTAVHQRQIRFFSMEHSVMMIVAIVVLTIGSIKTKYQTEDRKKFTTMAIWFSVSLLIILANIPWSFSPLVARPLLRLP